MNGSLTEVKRDFVKWGDKLINFIPTQRHNPDLFPMHRLTGGKTTLRRRLQTLRVLDIIPAQTAGQTSETCVTGLFIPREATRVICAGSSAVGAHRTTNEWVSNGGPAVRTD